MKHHFDVAVIGSGFAGSLTAMILKRQGHAVLLLESGKHPRFAIGESSTPLANLLWEELVVRYGLQRLAPLAKWGSWQAHYPQIACGLKRGFSFYHHSLGSPVSAHDRTRQLLVAASPHNDIADTHWFREQFDEFLAAEAEREGVAYWDQAAISSVEEGHEGLRFEGHRNGVPFNLRADFVIDATGHAGCLARHLQIPEAPLPGVPKTSSLYTHFRGVHRFGGSLESGRSDGGKQPPFPPDDAALHHVFDGGWIWVLRFNNGLTSAGVAATEEVASRFRFQNGEAAWGRLLEELPAVKNQFAHAEAVRPFVYAPRVSFRRKFVTGKRWALLPSAAGFVDPLLSTGFPLTLLGIGRLAEAFQLGIKADAFPALLEDYGRQTEEELLAAARLVGALYRTMEDFRLFAPLSLVYFAAASYAESARRLGKTQLASSFLLHDHPVFGRAAKELLNQLIDGPRLPAAGEVQTTVMKLIDPVNVAGLGKTARQNWYGVEAEDLLQASGKLQSSREEIETMLDLSGFWSQYARA